MAEQDTTLNPEGTQRAATTAENVKSGMTGGLDNVHSVATEGVYMVRDVTSDAIRAIGEVGNVAIDTTHGLLLGIADGLRDVITHIVPFEASRRQPPPPTQRP
jgi:hypothetical protein